MKRLILSFIFSVLFLTMHAQNIFDIQGHRGARGLYPENSIEGFIEAVKLGVNTLEMDVVVTRDMQLVVSHEPWLSNEICNVTGSKEQNNIYQLNYAEVKSVDCGLKVNNRFPEQKKTASVKPLLKDVIDSVEHFIAANKLPAVRYNIETKCSPEGDNIFHPAPDKFISLLYNLLLQKNIQSKCIIQSFDIRTLQILHKTDPSVTTALLVFNGDSFRSNLQTLGFIPDIYSPNFILVNRKLVQYCRKSGIKVIPWTINDSNKMKQMKRLGVDGIITDYPDIAVKYLR